MNAAVVWKVLQRYCYFAVFQLNRFRPAGLVKVPLVVLMVTVLPGVFAFGQPADTFELSLSVVPTAGGTISPAPGMYSLKRDSVITLSALPATGYNFDHWSSGVADSLAITTTVTLDTNKTIAAYFSLKPTITVTSPNGGEAWMQGSAHDLTWTSQGISGNVKISFSANGGTNWTIVAESTPNDGTLNWTVNGSFSVNCLIRIEGISGNPFDQSDGPFTISLAPVDQRIGLSAGWNLFSLNVVPERTGMRQIVQQLIDRGSLIKVQDEEGNTLERNPISHNWVNRIGSWEPDKGYRIRMSHNDTLRVHGFPVEGPVTIHLKTGWNIIGYPLSFAVNATEILASLMNSGSLDKVQDETGYSLEQLSPVSDWINNIGTLDPGEGYQIRVNADIELTLTPVFQKSALGIEPLNPVPAHFSRIFSGNGLDHMNIFVSFSDEGVQPETGDEIGIFDGEICVGAGVIGDANKKIISLVASADDLSTPAIDGFVDGRPIQVRVWKNTLQVKKQIEKTEVLAGTLIFSKQGTVWINISGQDDFRQGIHTGLGGIYPNPFSNGVWIPFSLDRENEVDISIFNLAGDKIASVVHEKLPAGDHLVRWNTSSYGSGLIPGSYVCKMTVSDEVFAKKLTGIQP
jgi:hypothetical protein